MIKLAAFLGNPGVGYARNRHNAGRMTAQAFPFYPSLSWQKKHNGLYASHNGIHFIMPETYMNLSGVSVQAAASFFKINIEEIIIVHDELELPLGTISLKNAGGLGGHNGLRSLNKCFGSADFWRLRIGIGRPGTRLPGEGGHASKEAGGEVMDWVLNDFTAEEKEILNPALNAAADLLIQIFENDPDTLLKTWAKKKISIEEKEQEQNL
ncbi:MAG: aminoacyl-tRNA hydrolase [Treponema sp.]|nr:aminoacyl-tRNA hydrolase [Treponema sp.]